MKQRATNCRYSWCPWLSSWMVPWVMGRNLSSPTARTSLWTSMWRGRPGHQPASQTTGCSVYRLRFAGQTAAQFAEFSWPSITKAGTWTSPGYTLVCQGGGGGGTKDNCSYSLSPPPPSLSLTFFRSLPFSLSTRLSNMLLSFLYISRSLSLLEKIKLEIKKKKKSWGSPR